MSTHTVELHRVFKSTPERVYRAFITADAFAKWLPPHGFVGTVHEMDSRVGGRYRMSFTNFASGHNHAFGGAYLELEPGKRLRYTAEFDAPELPGQMQTSVTLREVSCGVEVNIRQEGIPSAIPAEGMPSRLAGVARTAGEAGRGRHQRLEPVVHLIRGLEVVGTGHLPRCDSLP